MPLGPAMSTTDTVSLVQKTFIDYYAAVRSLYRPLPGILSRLQIAFPTALLYKGRI